MARSKRVEVPRANARTYLAKSKQFADAAGQDLAAARFDATLLSAVHAAISAIDAVTVALGGQRSTDSDHMRLVDLLEEVAGDSGEARSHGRQLSALLGKKNLVEYESRRVTADEAREGVDRAHRLTDWASKIVRDARV